MRASVAVPRRQRLANAILKPRSKRSSMRRNLAQKDRKHWFSVVTVIVAKRIFVEITLKIQLADRVMHCAHSVLQQARKSLDPLGAVCKRCLAEPADPASNSPLNSPLNSPCNPHIRTRSFAERRILRDVRYKNPPPPVQPRYDHRFARSGQRRMRSPGSWADGSAIWLVEEKGSDLTEHSPRSFVGKSGLAGQLFCGNAARTRGHQVNGAKPDRKRRPGLCKNRAGSRVHVAAAAVATIGSARSDPVVFCNISTALAIDSVRIQMIAQPFQASRIIGKVTLKILNRIPLFLALAHEHRKEI